jgi:hypothetical protein
MRRTRKVLPILGFDCDCGHSHKYSEYIYDHWKASLDYKCPDCQKWWVITLGIATPKIEKKSRR